MKKFYGYSLVYGEQYLGQYSSIEECRKYWKWTYIWSK